MFSTLVEFSVKEENFWNYLSLETDTSHNMVFSKNLINFQCLGAQSPGNKVV